MVNSRRKGNEAEAFVVKKLKTIFGGGPWERKSMGIPGPDILAPKGFPYACEVKNHADIKAIHLLGKPNAKLLQFWKQTEEQARALKLAPLLIIKVESFWFVSEDGCTYGHFDKWCEAQYFVVTLAINAAEAK